MLCGNGRLSKKSFERCSDRRLNGTMSKFDCFPELVLHNSSVLVEKFNVDLEGIVMSVKPEDLEIELNRFSKHRPDIFGCMYMRTGTCVTAQL